MPGYSITSANQALDALGGTLPGTPVNVLAEVQLATGDPGTTGANAATSTPQACTWNAAANRSKTNATPLTFTGQSGATPVTHFFTRSTGGTTIGISGALGSPVTATTITVAAGALTLSA